MVGRRADSHIVTVLRYWVPLLIVLTACGDGAAPQLPQITPGFPVIVFPDPVAPSVLEAPAARMRAALRDTYVLKPDRRFLGAVAEIHRLLSGVPADVVQVTRGNHLWLIHYRGENVGELPDMPGFEDASTLLKSWATRLIARHPLGTEGAPTAAERDSIGVQLDRLDAPFASAALRVTDSGWQRGRHADWLPLAARGLTLLAIQLPKVDVVGDPLVARALAATVLAGAAKSDNAVAEMRTLLAEHMGYSGDAARLAARLRPGHPVRLLAMRDRAGLRTAAQNAQAGLAPFLYVRSVADLGDRHGFRDAIAAVDVEATTSGILGSAVTANTFETDGLLISAMPITLAAEMGPATRRIGFIERLVGAVGALLGQPPPIEQRVWAGVLITPSGGGRALAAFEEDAAALDRQVGGPFLNADLFALYFRAQLHGAFERACIHHVDGLATVPGSAQFVAAFDDVNVAMWTEVVRWCRNRAEHIAGRGSVEQILHDLLTVPAMSEPAVRRSVGDIVELSRYMDAAHLDAARAVFDRLDSRPQHLRRASNVAYERLVDAPLSERLGTRLLALASVDYPELEVWYAAYRGDAPALRAHARDRALTLEARAGALRNLLAIAADSTATFKAFDELLDEDPQNWAERGRYIDILQASRRFQKAAGVAQAWLVANGEDRGFDYIFARLALARQFELMGRLDEAFALLEPLQSSYQAGVLTRSALIALGRRDFAQAEALALRAVDRYPGLGFARAALAAVLWAQRRHTEVPPVLHDSQHALRLEDWREDVGPTFVRAFGRRPLSEGTAAFDALAQAGVPVRLLKTLPSAAADSGYHALALSLKQRVLSPPGGNEQGDDAEAVEYYRYLVAARGKVAALDWLGARWQPSEFRRQALTVYRNGLNDLLWDPRVERDDGPEGSYHWLIRALAWVHAPQRDPARGAQLRAYYAQPDSRFYYVAGRCVLGMESEDRLLTFATNPHRRAEVSYYLGIRALGQQRYVDASDWFRVTIETRSARDWELLWAKDLLTRWMRTSRELRIAVPQIAAKPPRF